MIATVSKVGKLKNALDYDRDKKKDGRIILSSGIDPNMPTKALAAALMAMHNHKYKVAAHSIVISHGKEDSQAITPEQEIIVLKKFVQELQNQGVDLESVPWLIARHNNTEHLHYHMIVMGTRYDYSRFNDYYLGARATRAAARVSRLFDMQTAPKADANLDVVRLPRKKKKARKKQYVHPAGIITPEVLQKSKKHIYRKAAIAAARKRKEEEKYDGKSRVPEKAIERLQTQRQNRTEIQENRNLDNGRGVGDPKGRGR